MLIRDEHPNDKAAITEVIYSAFLNHPQHAPGTPPTEHRIVEALRARGKLTRSRVAESDGAVVGHVAFSPVTINGADCGWYGLGPLSVLPARQGLGIGSALVRDGIAQIQALGAAGIVLLGNPKYYGRFGFEAYPGLILPDVPAQYFQGLPLKGAWASGVVAYDEGFYVA